MKVEDVLKDEKADVTNLDDDAVIDAILNKNSVKLHDSQTVTLQRTGLYWLSEWFFFDFIPQTDLQVCFTLL